MMRILKFNVAIKKKQKKLNINAMIVVNNEIELEK